MVQCIVFLLVCCSVLLLQPICHVICKEKGMGAHTPRAVEQAGRQASWQSSSVSHTLGAVNGIPSMQKGCSK